MSSRTAAAVLAAKSVLFTLVVPGTVAGYLPYWLSRRLAPTASPWALIHEA
jgi:hypothetical protein